MYNLKPKAVFAHKRVFENPFAIARMERMLDALQISRADVREVDINDFDEIIAISGATDSIATDEVKRGGHGRVRLGNLPKAPDPVMVFNTFVWDESKRLPPARKLAHPQARRLQRMLCGVAEDYAYSRREIYTPDHPEYVCQGGWGIHTLGGCVHNCRYCDEGFILNIMLDLEDYREHLAQMFARRPEQLLYRYDLESDVLIFEPEYGASEVLGKCFAEHDKYLLLYTRSANVGYLAELPYRRNVLINWTLSMETQAKLAEPDSPTLDERIEAMRFCQQHGYVVRAGFSPTIPYADWRAEITDMLERLFAKVQPEVLRAWVLAMMEAAEFGKIFDVDKMDQHHMARMREAAEELEGQRHAPFPLDVRAEIYEHYIDEIKRISPETPFNLCSEHPQLWQMLADKLDMTPDRMFCCCGALSVPGGWWK